MKTPPRRVLRVVGVPVLFAAIYVAVGLRFGVWGVVSASAVWVVWLFAPYGRRTVVGPRHPVEACDSLLWAWPPVVGRHLPG
jgi:hypothetical protein